MHSKRKEETKKASSGTSYFTLTPFQLSQLESIVSGDRDLRATLPPYCSQGPCPLRPGDFRRCPRESTTGNAFELRRGGEEENRRGATPTIAVVEIESAHEAVLRETPPPHAEPETASSNLNATDDALHPPTTNSRDRCRRVHSRQGETKPREK